MSKYVNKDGGGSENDTALAIIRITGPCSIPLLQSLSPTLKLPNPRVLKNVKLFGVDDKPLDDGMAVIFKGPMSYTGEDLVELHLHGSRGVVNGVLLDLNKRGYRMAERGEFTMRAFDNGKMDLYQVESLGSLLTADTEMQRVQALRSQGGKQIMEGWRKGLVMGLAHAEAIIDFSGDSDNTDLQDEAAIWGGILEEVKILRGSMESELSTGRGEVVREGVKVALTGPPNAGKSSLINRLLKRDFAIVSSTPGTTRDVMTAEIDIGGVLVKVSDTAGIRETGDGVEREGVKRAIREVEDADVVVEIRGVGEGDWDGVGEEAVRVRNKIDLGNNEGEGGVLGISAETGEGIEEFVEVLKERVMEFVGNGGGGIGQESVVVTRARHRGHVENAVEALYRFEEMAGYGEEGVDMAAEELRLATTEIARIVGKVDVEDVLDSLFKDFCVGK